MRLLVVQTTILLVLYYFCSYLVINLSGVLAQQITGKIISCKAWVLNRHPELRSFLKDGDAKYYQGVHIKSAQASSFSSKAMLYIYHDGIEVEQVELSALATKDEMNQLMLQKGFQKKSPEFIQADQERRRRRRRNFGDEQQEQQGIETVHHVKESSCSTCSFAETLQLEDANMEETTKLPTEEL